MSARIIFLLIVFAFAVPSVLAVEQVAAAGPIIARGAERVAIKSTPILYRPNRPLHVYGNTVRRRHDRGR